MVFCQLNDLYASRRQKAFEATWLIDEEGEAKVLEHFSTLSSENDRERTVNGTFGSCIGTETL